MEPTATASILALVGALLIVAALFSPVSSRIGIPMLLLFIAIGMAAGVEGMGVAFDDYGLAFRLGMLGLVLILFDGGLNTPYTVLRHSLPGATSLATLGVVLTAAVMVGVGLLLGLPLAIALLIGAVVSSTDAAAVFSVLRSGGIRLRVRVGGWLEAESGLNDPMAFVLTVTASEWVLRGSRFGFEHALSLVLQFGVGVIAGIAIGMAGRALLRLVPLPAVGLYPVLTTALAFTAFGATSLLGGSGLLAVYLAAVVLARGHLPYRAGIRRVHDALAWLAQMLMFLVIGLLVTPSRLLDEAVIGVSLALALACVARPLAVFLSLAPVNRTWQESAFVSWVGLRGAVPIVLSTYPVLRGVEGAEIVFYLVFFIVIVNAFVPGATVGWLARHLGMARPVPPEAPAGIDLVTSRDYEGQFVWYQVMPPAAVVDTAVKDLPLPERSVIVMLVRGEHIEPTRGETRLEAGDHVCLFVGPDDRHLLDLLFGFAEREET